MFFCLIKNIKKEENIKKEKELRIKQAEERKIVRIEKAKNIEEFWNTIKIGNEYQGTITKIMDYGIFVDLGLATGLVHKSELVWDRNQKLEDSFNVGDQIDVKIKDFNKDDRKINFSIL
ncbi:MAG: S1 RNA-binding domain-containing protein [Clostridia bacterium]